MAPPRVFPFADLSEKQDQEYFADGMADEIINLLAQVPELYVPARTSSFYFKGKSTKIPDIALARTLLAEGQAQAAVSIAQQEVDEASRLEILPIVLQAVGRKAEADEDLQALSARFADSAAFYVAMVYAYRGEGDHALEWLDRAYRQKDVGLVEIVGEPLFKNLAADPRYKAFLRKMKLPD